MKKCFYLFTMSAFIFVISGCNPYNNEGEGAVAGAAVGSQIQKPEPPPQQVIIAQPAPVVAAAQAPSATYSGDTVTVNVPNANGTYTAVVLKRSGNGYVGPQGEYYDQIPTTAQLQAMYGK